MDLAMRSRSDSEASLKSLGEANPWASKYRTVVALKPHRWRACSMVEGSLRLQLDFLCYWITLERKASDLFVAKFAQVKRNY